MDHNPAAYLNMLPEVVPFLAYCLRALAQSFIY